MISFLTMFLPSTTSPSSGVCFLLEYCRMLSWELMRFLPHIRHVLCKFLGVFSLVLSVAEFASSPLSLESSLCLWKPKYIAYSSRNASHVLLMFMLGLLVDLSDYSIYTGALLTVCSPLIILMLFHKHWCVHNKQHPLNGSLSQKCATRCYYYCF